MLASGKSTTQPLLLLLPFVVSAGIQVFWLIHPHYDNSAIINSALFVPFLCAWGLQFAHQVGRMILAHVTSSPFPWWDWMWVWSLVGAVDANLPMLAGRSVPLSLAILLSLPDALAQAPHNPDERGESRDRDLPDAGNLVRRLRAVLHAGYQ
jgi:hypothetical protein